MKWYNKEDYYNFILQIWKPNILLKLKEAENKNEKDEILKQYKIDSSKWDEEFREYFNTIININPIKILAEKIKYNIKEDYNDLNELLKSAEKCKNNIEKDKESFYMKIIKSNLDTSMSKIIDQFVSNFLSKLSNEYNKFFDEINEQKEKKAVLKILNVKDEYKKGKKINNCKLSEKNRKQLINTIIKIYKKEYVILDNKDNINFNEEYKKLQELQSKFNIEKGFYETDIVDKGKILFNNEMIKYIILCLNIVKLGYNVLHISNILLNYDEFGIEVKKKINEIKKNFISHQNDIKLISDNINEAIEEIINNQKNFQKDLEDIQKNIDNNNLF